MTDSELLAKLKDDFVTHRTDYIFVDSYRQDRGIKLINAGVDKGWLKTTWEGDEQYRACKARLTPEGRKAAGLS